MHIHRSSLRPQQKSICMVSGIIGLPVASTSILGSASNSLVSSCFFIAYISSSKVLTHVQASHHQLLLPPVSRNRLFKLRHSNNALSMAPSRPPVHNTRMIGEELEAFHSNPTSTATAVGWTDLHRWLIVHHVHGDYADLVVSRCRTVPYRTEPRCPRFCHDSALSDFHITDRLVVQPVHKSEVPLHM
ncbi:hypothetical protein P154DRAFT_504 [Amniculicola lignicola CBS 123094]|uniref:Uncharacterized protein n=1 Tax=Amniculicola lignicola CBS 123094 TaxID=1392246 RepID=A0A6A5X448_9PLEO|nr:hypothetical protein P154DRAFT_504 [Amniculicola lignicola CBS 123094]